jgi:cyanate permease
MLLRRRLEYVLCGVGLALVLGALFRPMSPARGWALLLGFGLVSVAYLAAMIAMPSRRENVSLASICS